MTPENNNTVTQREENVFAGVDGRAQLSGTEVGRSTQQNHIHIGCHQLFVAVKSCEAVILVDSVFLGQSLLQP